MKQKQPCLARLRCRHRRLQFEEILVASLVSRFGKVNFGINGSAVRPETEAIWIVERLKLSAQA